VQRHQGKRAIVTGAASGIGKASAIRLASEGAHVHCLDLQEEACAQTAAEIRASGAEATSASVDVSDADACASCVEHGIAELGGLDVLCNIAGVLGSAHTADLEIATWDRVLAINLSGTFYMTRAALPQLSKDGGAIVNMASVAGLQGVPYGAAYSASKAGVIGLTRSIAAEYSRQGVRANAICPGGVATPMTLGGFSVENADPKLFAKIMPMMPRIGQPEEIAALVAYLASEEAAYITGTTVTIDGGQMA